MFVDTLHAMASPAQAQGGQAANPIAGFLPLILIFVVFYFLLIRPQQKKAKEHKKMIDALQKGDRVITSAGILGTISGFQNNIVDLNIAENVTIKITRDAIGRLLSANE